MFVKKLKEHTHPHTCIHTHPSPTEQTRDKIYEEEFEIEVIYKRN